MNDKLSTREIEKKDIELIANYWLKSDPAFLEAMGVDLKKLFAREQWIEMLSQQLHQPFLEKKSYCIIWEINGKAIGHSNVNKIVFGDEAFMHLHIWDIKTRQKGIGLKFVKMTLPYFFKNLALKNLYCEPYALNPAPNRALQKAGFIFQKEYITTPGLLNFEQRVNRWHLSLKQFRKMEKG